MRQIVTRSLPLFAALVALSGCPAEVVPWEDPGPLPAMAPAMPTPAADHPPAPAPSPVFSGTCKQAARLTSLGSDRYTDAVLFGWQPVASTCAPGMTSAGRRCVPNAVTPTALYAASPDAGWFVPVPTAGTMPDVVSVGSDKGIEFLLPVIGATVATTSDTREAYFYMGGGRWGIKPLPPGDYLIGSGSVPSVLFSATELADCGL